MTKKEFLKICNSNEYVLSNNNVAKQVVKYLLVNKDDYFCLTQPQTVILFIFILNVHWTLNELIDLFDFYSYIDERDNTYHVYGLFCRLAELNMMPVVNDKLYNYIKHLINNNYQNNRLKCYAISLKNYVSNDVLFDLIVNYNIQGKKFMDNKVDSQILKERFTDQEFKKLCFILSIEGELSK